jgi:predicted nucleotidyltransferase
MGTSLLPSDFKDFLKLLNSKKVEYLLIGGYAVGYYGYSRATADIDIWIAINPENAQKITDVITEFFGFSVEGATPELFLQENKIARMGVPPFRIEVLTTISGVSFEECYAERVVDTLDGIEVNLISLQPLKVNKKASGRLKDLNDLEYLE